MMQAIAFMWAYNEDDIIGHVVHHLQTEGVGVHVFNDGSTDDTLGVVSRSGATLELWQTREATASWTAMLRHTEETALDYARQHGSFWAIHHDADEIRRSAVPGERLLDFFARARQAGWTAVDHHVQVFAPRDGYDPALHHPETYFTEPFQGHMDAHNGQIKAWWQTPEVRVDLAKDAGHKVAFPGRRVCPEKLILKHYPMRGAEQRAAKARSRAARWDPQERAKGWHAQYSM